MRERIRIVGNNLKDLYVVGVEIKCNKLMIQQDIKKVRDKNKNNYKRIPDKNRIYLCMI